MYKVQGQRSQAGSAHNSLHDPSVRSNYFLINYNIIMLACHYGSANILNYVNDHVLPKCPDPERARL